MKKYYIILCVYFMISNLCAYSPISVKNNTLYPVQVKIEYDSTRECPEDNVVIAPHSISSPISRVSCLIRKISATIKDSTGDKYATPYTSPGTAYSQFQINGPDNKSQYRPYA